jgi:NitT/TauT family transport system ATP-binding protein
MEVFSNDVVTLREVSKRYRSDANGAVALAATNLTVRDGESVSVVGPSGCGKSTLLLLLAGLEQPSSGSVEFRNKPLLSPHRKVALVLQDYGLFPWKTVIKNVELGLRIRGERIDRQLIGELLEELEIADKQQCYPHQLSGGQRQRVALARALVLNPSLLLLDEPFAAIDALTRERLQELVAEARQRRGFAMVIVTHDIREAVRLGDRICIMGRRPGRIIAVVDNPQGGDDGYRGSDDFNRIVQDVRQKLGQRT